MTVITIPDPPTHQHTNLPAHQYVIPLNHPTTNQALIDTIGEDADRKRHMEAIASLSQLINYFIYLGFIGMIVFYNQVT